MMLHVDLRQVIHALSDALDLVGVDEKYHGKRVAFMAVECGRVLNMSSGQLDVIYDASLLHDCGVSSTQVHRQLVSELDWNGSQHHCQQGEKLLKRCNLLADLPTIVRWHHTHWQDMPAEVDETDALISNLIFMTDRVDALIAQHADMDILIARTSICAIIKKHSGTFFQEKLVGTFLSVAESELFWLMLEPRHLTAYIFDMGQASRRQRIDRRTLLEIASIFADIVDAKSSFTEEHSQGVARLSLLMGTHFGLDEETLGLLEVAGLLHDLGKLNVPDEILDKPGPLTQEERVVMMRHSFESYQILHRITGFEDIAQWAAFHHEALSGDGYPFHKNHKNLGIEARIIAVADVFQALVQVRPYRDSLPPEKIIFIINNMVDEGRLDRELVAFATSHVDEFIRAAQCLECPL